MLERGKDYLLLEYSPLPESLDPVYPAAHGGPQGYPHQAADQPEGRHQGQVLGVDPEDQETEAEVLQSERSTNLRGISHCLERAPTRDFYLIRPVDGLVSKDPSSLSIITMSNLLTVFECLFSKVVI